MPTAALETLLTRIEINGGDRDAASAVLAPALLGGIGWERTHQVLATEEPARLFLRQFAMDLMFQEPLPLLDPADIAEEICRYRDHLDKHIQSIVSTGRVPVFCGTRFFKFYLQNCYPDSDSDTQREALLVIQRGLALATEACRLPALLPGLPDRFLKLLERSSHRELIRRLLLRDLEEIASPTEGREVPLRVQGIYGIIMFLDLLSSGATAESPLRTTRSALTRVCESAGVGRWEEALAPNGTALTYLAAVGQPWRPDIDVAMDNYLRAFFQHWNRAASEQRLAALQDRLDVDSSKVSTVIENLREILDRQAGPAVETTAKRPREKELISFIRSYLCEEWDAGTFPTKIQIQGRVNENFELTENPYSREFFSRGEVSRAIEETRKNLGALGEERIEKLNPKRDIDPDAWSSEDGGYLSVSP